VPDGQDAKATLTIKYQNNGKFDWKTTRYNTYVRVYVPAGATLISSSGAQLKERSTKPGTVETTTELGKTVFAAYKSIEPGTTSELTLTYTLPKSVTDQWSKENYTLIWQKQPGMTTPDMNLSITSPRNAKLVDGVDNESRIRQAEVSYTGKLNKDRTITIHY
jgi:hypothetical protein